ncbi:MAG: CSLREA domain-containing protein [Bacteroidota bacterium]
MRTFLLAALLATLPGAAPAADIWVNTLVDDSDPTTGTCNLREAITAANTNAPVDGCAAGDDVNDTIYFSVTGTIDLLLELPPLTGSIRVIGPGVDYLTIDVNGFGRLFPIQFSAPNGKVFEFAGFTGTGGDASASTIPGGNGGALRLNNGETGIFRDLRLTGNQATGLGGAIDCFTCTLTLERVTLDGNSASGGGGFSYLREADVRVVESTIINNTAAGDGGGIKGDQGLPDSGNSEIDIFRTTISQNVAGSSLGDTGGGFSIGIDDTVFVSSSTIVNNTAGKSGGVNMDGLGLDAEITVRNTIISNNTAITGTGPNVSTSFAGLVTSLGGNVINDNTDASDFPVGTPNTDNDFVGDGTAPLVISLGPLQDNGGPTLTHLPLLSGTNYIVDKGTCFSDLYDQRGAGTDSSTRIFDNPGETNTLDGCDSGAVERGAQIRTSKLDVDILLSGAHTDVLMRTDLTSQIPLAQPYNTAPWNYAGPESLTSVPSDMVDWVLLEVYKGGHDDPGGLTLIRRRAVLLNDNGSMSAPDNFNGFRVDPGLYYIGVKHRNHLPVVSELPVELEWNQTTTYNFRDAATPAFGLDAQEELSTTAGTLFALWPGDANGNGAVNARDALNGWFVEFAIQPPYSYADYNLDGIVDIQDLLEEWVPSNGRWAE